MPTKHIRILADHVRYTAELAQVGPAEAGARYHGQFDVTQQKFSYIDRPSPKFKPAASSNRSALRQGHRPPAGECCSQEVIFDNASAFALRLGIVSYGDLITIMRHEGTAVTETVESTIRKMNLLVSIPCDQPDGARDRYFATPFPRWPPKIPVKVLLISRWKWGETNRFYEQKSKFLRGNDAYPAVRLMLKQ